jgi:hypothetical protein
MVVVMTTLLGNAIWRTCAASQKDEEAALGRYETLSFHECAVRFQALQGNLSGTPKTAREYFTNLGKANMLEGAAKKALHHPTPVLLSPENDRDETITRNIPVNIPDMVRDYAGRRPGLVFMTSAQIAEWDAASAEFQNSSENTLVRSGLLSISDGARIGFWWFMFHVGAMPFIFIHYCIRIRENGMKVRYEVLGNPAFPLWLFFWEIGLFRYPREVSVMAQIRRVRQWAALMLSTAIPCFAAGAGGKVCEKDPVRFSLSTSTGMKYLGLADEMLSQHPVQQTSFTAFLPCGIYAGAFNSASIAHNDDHPDYGNEVDITLGLNALIKGNAFNINGTYVDLSPLTQIPTGDVFQFSERVSRTLPLGKKQSIAPYIWLREVMPVRGPTPIGGWFGHGGAVFQRSFGSKVSNAIDLSTVWDSGALGNNPGLIGTATDTLSWKRGEHISLQLPINVQTPLTHTQDGRRTNVTAGIGISFSF